MADPKWLALARGEVGTKEWPGPSSNPTVEQYYLDAVGHRQRDDVPWCMAFVGAMVRRAGYVPPPTLMARSALTWPGAIKLSAPIPGAIVVFPRGRPPSGHVAIVDQVGPGWIDVIGGNQSDMVNRKRFPTRNVLGYRWPPGARLPGIPTLKALKRIEAKGELAVADKTAQQIMDEAQKLYSDADSVMSASGARGMAKTAASLIFYLAKLMLPSTHPAMKKALKLKAAKRVTRKK